MTRPMRNRVHVRRNLDLITERNNHEVAPEELGLDAGATSAIDRAFVGLYRTGLHPGIQLCLRRRGDVLFDRSIGYAGGVAHDDPLHGAHRVMQRDTPVCLFSASKAVTAMLVHKAAEEGLVDLEQRVMHYLPEYGCNGKADTTVKHLLAHRAGIPRIPMRRVDPSLLWDWDRAVATLCAARPVHGAGQQQAYHAITAGFILGELVQRVTGRGLNDVLAEWFTRPLGLRHFSFGLDRALHGTAARNSHTGPALLPPLSFVARRALGTDFERIPAISNTHEFMSAVIPAGNLYATADDICRFFEMLRQDGRSGGRQILRPETVARAVAPVGRIRIDKTLLVPVRFSMGLILGERPLGLYGPDCAGAYGHLGFMSIICWADPQRELSGALLTTGKTLALDGLGRVAALMAAIGRSVPRDARRPPSTAIRRAA